MQEGDNLRRRASWVWSASILVLTTGSIGRAAGPLGDSGSLRPAHAPSSPRSVQPTLGDSGSMRDEDLCYRVIQKLLESAYASEAGIFSPIATDASFPNVCDIPRIFHCENGGVRGRCFVSRSKTEPYAEALRRPLRKIRKLAEPAFSSVGVLCHSRHHRSHAS